MRLTSKSDRDTTHSMSALDQALTTLHVLGSVVQVIPVVGESLKSATEIVTKISMRDGEGAPVCLQARANP
jgi:hypothetical protein